MAKPYIPQKNLVLCVGKLRFCENATIFLQNHTLDLSYVVPVKYTVEILQNFVAFSEYMNFNMGMTIFDLYGHGGC